MAHARDRGRVVVVTGASAGVGRATVRRFASQGARIGLLARGRGGLEGAAREVEQAGGQALVLPTDVADFDQVDGAASAVEDAFGPIDVWVNNAMTTVFSPFVKIRPQEFKRVTEVTYLGYVHGTLAALRRMLPRDRGTIVQVGSALAFRGIPLQSAYCGAKHAIEGFTESIRTELMHDESNVRLTAVHMPALNTPQFDWCLSRLPRRAQPVPPIYQPEVAAEAIVYAADHPRRAYYVGGPTVKTIWGNRAAAWYADRVLAAKGYAGQQTEEDEDPNRPSNLWRPVPGDFGAHGRFDERSRERSVQAWASRNRVPVIEGAFGLVVLLSLTVIALALAA